jgi:hypothetical protein
MRILAKKDTKLFTADILSETSVVAYLRVRGPPKFGALSMSLTFCIRNDSGTPQLTPFGLCGFGFSPSIGFAPSRRKC